MGENLEAYANQVARDLSKLEAEHGGEIAPLYLRIDRPPVTWKRHAGTGRKGRTPVETRVEKQVIRTLAANAVKQWEARTGKEWPRKAWYSVSAFAFVDRFGRGDVDNYAKLMLDAVKGVAWSDDKRVISLTAQKCLHAKMHSVLSIKVVQAGGFDNVAP